MLRAVRRQIFRVEQGGAGTNLSELCRPKIGSDLEGSEFRGGASGDWACDTGTSDAVIEVPIRMAGEVIAFGFQFE